MLYTIPQISLQTEVMLSPLASSSSASTSMLTTPADFNFLGALAAAYTAFRSSLSGING